MKIYLTSVSSFQSYQLLRYATLVLTGIVFTRTSMTQAMIGEYETFLLVAGAVTFFWLNGMLKALLLNASGEKENHRESPAVFTAFVIISLFSLLSALFLVLLRPAISGFLLQEKDLPFITLLIVYIVFGMPANLVEYLYLLRKKYSHIAWYGVISFGMQLVAVLVPAVAGAGLVWVVTGLAGSMVLRYLWLLIVMIREFKVGFSVTYAKDFLKLSWPLVMSTLLSGSAQYIDSFIITSRFSSDLFAIFQYGARELPLAVLLANALSNSLLPGFAGKEGLPAVVALLRNHSRRLMHLLFPLTGLLLLLSHPLFPVLFNPSFAASATIFNIYLMLIISRLAFPQTILTGLRHTRLIMLASLAELAVNVTFSLLLVNWLGIAGVAAGTFIACLFEKVLLAAMVKRVTGISPGTYIPLKLLTLYSAGIVSIFIFAEIYIRLWN